MTKIKAPVFQCMECANHFGIGQCISCKYEELIFAVGNAYPGESRHQTALRYIRQAESNSDSTEKTTI